MFEARRQLEKKEVVGEEQLSIISSDLEMALQRAVSLFRTVSRSDRASLPSGGQHLSSLLLTNHFL